MARRKNYCQAGDGDLVCYYCYEKAQKHLKPKVSA